jgi:threonine synthase
MSSANPFNVEGYKTISYEIFRDIGLPGFVFIPMGSGTLALGIWKGFKELLQMSLIPEMPHLVGVQAERVNPIDRAYQKGEMKVKSVIPGRTVATGVVTDNPGIAGTAALRAIRDTRGFTISVPEEKIIDTFKLLPREEGIFAEPTGALSIAGLTLACERGLVPEGRKAVCINTASGFKDLDAFKRLGYAGDQVSSILPDIKLVKEILNIK